MIKTEEVILRGLPVSKGIGIGLPVFFTNWDEDVPVVQIPHKEIEEEIDRYRRALRLSREDLERLHKLSLHNGPPEIVAILGTHLEMMQDPMMTTVMEDKIRDLQRNTESIFFGLIEEYKQRFSTLQDHYFHRSSRR